MRSIASVILGLPFTEESLCELMANAGYMQKLIKKKIKAGSSVERAVLDVANTYKLSMHDMELLHLAITGI